MRCYVIIVRKTHKDKKHFPIFYEKSALDVESQSVLEAAEVLEI